MYIQTYNNCNKQIVQEKKVYCFKLARYKNNNLNIFEMNITKERIFVYNRFRQKNSIYIVFLKKTMQEIKHKF